MNKTLFILFIPIFFFFSCVNKNENLPRKARGKINAISVVIDDQLWNGEIGDFIRNRFAIPVVGLPQEEPIFTINQYPVKLMEGFMTDSRTIIVVKKENQNQFSINKNQYASPQNVFHISGKTNEEILEIIEKNTLKMIQIIKESEIVECQRINNKSLLNSQIIANTFKISLKIPLGYSYVFQKSDFIWLKKEVVGGNTSLLIYQVPLSSIKKEFNPVLDIIRIRDSIGSIYIRGTEPDTPMITEEGYSPYFFKVKLGDKETYETKGTWELKNDFMSGPFINYSVIDEQNNRVLVLEGFCYSPSKEKRDLMHELESIIKSIVILK